MADIDYEAVIADLERRRDDLEVAINAMRQIAGQGEAPVLSGGTPNGAAGVASDSFFGMQIIDAAKKFLAFAKRPQAAPDIANALKRGGLLNESKNFTATVYTTLRREESKNRSVIQMPDKAWALSEWYPAGARARTGPRETADLPAHLTDAGGGASDPIGPLPPDEQSPDDAA